MLTGQVYSFDAAIGLGILPGSRALRRSEIDQMNKELDKLQSFILPGGSQLSSFLHLSRSNVRRAERSIIELNDKEKVSTDIIKYVNRLSDFLFVAARFENKKEGDILWIPNKN